MIFFQTIRRDIKIAFRKPSNIFNPLLFFIISITLFPLAISPEAQVLSGIASGLIWVLVLLSVLLSLNLMFNDDFENGILEQITTSSHSLPLIMLAKATTHFLLTGIPIILLSPFLGLILFMSIDGILLLMLTILMTTPTLSLIGSIGSSLVVGVKNSGMLLSLIILPLYIPILIFAAGAITNFNSGLEITGNLYFLATLFVAFLMLSPFVSSLAIKISLE